MHTLRNLFAASVCVCLAAVFCPSCTDKAPEHPDLEGFWKEERIEDVSTGASEECDRLYWAFQLGVSQLNDYGSEGGEMLICRYEYDEGKATLRMHDFRPAGEEYLKVFGIPSEEVTFEVVRLDGDHMLLRSGNSMLYFKSF